MSFFLFKLFKGLLRNHLGLVEVSAPQHFVGYIRNVPVPVPWTHVCSSSNMVSYFLLQLDTNRDSGIDANSQGSATSHDKEEKGGSGSNNNNKKNKKKKNKNKEKNEKNQETTPKRDSPTTTTEEKENNNNAANGVAATAAAAVTAPQPESAGERS